ncbi:hypothetical protein JTE90_022430 [Oedothorax gibbosus]|uniref:Uncharacterized protein n=1 Tax=Oedothorax gibbosus TaxID=931172 RepID=A0AAV6TT05_9ARAC|nr:hypothetical protein JTE90_022430 [Oedothorax gibbosus]
MTRVLRKIHKQKIRQKNSENLFLGGASTHSRQIFQKHVIGHIPRSKPPNPQEAVQQTLNKIIPETIPGILPTTRTPPLTGA